VEVLDEHERPLRLTPTRVLVGLVVLASFGLWAYAYSGRADRPPPDLLDDPVFAQVAEPRCAEARRQLAQLEPAYEAADNVDRARTVDQANAILSSMVADLRSQVSGTDRDRQILGDWLQDWETFLGNRVDYAQRLRQDREARFYQSDVVSGEMLDRRLSRMADTNDMSSCGNPGDVG
jgi:hypothetical protein